MFVTTGAIEKLSHGSADDRSFASNAESFKQIARRKLETAERFDHERTGLSRHTTDQHLGALDGRSGQIQWKADPPVGGTTPLRLSRTTSLRRPRHKPEWLGLLVIEVT